MNGSRRRGLHHDLLLVITVALALAPGGSRAEEHAPEPPASDASTVLLSERALANATIHTEPARKGDLRKRLRVPGRISANQSRTAKVPSTLEGRISRLGFEVGDAVRAGDVMALVDTPELMGKPLELRSPIAGRVIERAHALGETVERGAAIDVVSDPATVWVIGEVRERDVALVAPGQEIAFRVVSYPDDEFRGTVARVGSEIEPASRTMEIRAELPNPRGLL